jgi:hypothetical protein
MDMGLSQGIKQTGREAYHSQLMSKSSIHGCIHLWEPSMGTSHRLRNCYGCPNRYRSNNLINRITMVTNNRNSTGTVTSGLYIGFAPRHFRVYDYITKSRRQQAEVIKNYENENVRYMTVQVSRLPLWCQLLVSCRA